MHNAIVFVFIVDLYFYDNINKASGKYLRKKSYNQLENLSMLKNQTLLYDHLSIFVHCSSSESNTNMSKLFYCYLVTKKLDGLRSEVRNVFHRAVYCNLLLNSNSTNLLQITIVSMSTRWRCKLDTWQLLYNRVVTCRRLLFHYKKSILIILSKKLETLSWYSFGIFFLSANKLSRGCIIFLFSDATPMHLATTVTMQRNSLTYTYSIHSRMPIPIQYLNGFRPCISTLGSVRYLGCSDCQAAMLLLLLRLVLYSYGHRVVGDYIHIQ